MRSSMIRQNKMGSSRRTRTKTTEHGCDNEWEEIKCPICMEHPHNAILMRCSSYQLGCRPYMCNTSSRHSNCLDKFCNSSESSPSSVTLPSNDSQHCRLMNEEQIVDGDKNLTCPLCRGVVYGWTVIDPVRRYLDTKPRTCSSEDCDFIGNYSDLRTHARLEHPFSRPTEPDLGRERDWARIEQAQEFGDLASTIEQQEQDEVEIQIVVPQSNLRALGRLIAALANPIQTNSDDDTDEDEQYIDHDDDGQMIEDNGEEWPVATTQSDDDDGQMIVDNGEEWSAATTTHSGVRRRRDRISRMRSLNVRHDDNFFRRRGTSHRLSQRNGYLANSINNHDLTRRRG